MAHITIITSGSRGDVQPYIALGLGLQSGGHAVRLATHSIYADWIGEYGLEFRPMEGDPMELVQRQSGREWMESGQSGLNFVRGFRKFLGPILYRATEDVLAACRDTDLIVFSGTGFYSSYSVAEKLDKPFMPAYLQPINPTREFPSALFPTRFKGGGIFNYLTHVIGGQSFWQMARPLINNIRRDVLGLRSLPLMGPFLEMIRRRLPALHGYSPTVLPKPKEWHEAYFVTGFWFMDDDAFDPPEPLARFLAEGESPVYVGFGSMVGGDADRLTAVTLDALQRSGRRGILLSGWAGLGAMKLPETILKLDSVPHSWLFPRTSAVVHHGGVGTTHTGLRAGVPNIVVPFFGDQPFWGDRVHALGAGPRPIAQDKLTAENLAEAIAAATSDGDIRERAAEVGQRIQAERGVAEAVAIVSRYMEQRPRFMESWNRGSYP